MVIIKKVIEPQDVFILPISFNSEKGGIDESFSITDDYSGFGISDGKEIVYIESTGFVTIVTEEELAENSGKLWDSDEDYEEDAMVLKNFTGVIKLCVYNSSHKDILNPAKYDPKEYIHHQNLTTQEDDDVDDIVVELPCPLGELVPFNELIEKYKTSFSE